MTSRLLMPVAVAVLLSATAAARQAPTPPPQEPPRPTFRSGVQIIEVDVRVFDKEGRFVADLGRDDFEVIEEGAPQRVEAMYLVGAPAAGPAAAAADPAPAGGPPPAGPAATPAAAQTWVFVFDLNHLTPGSGFDRARLAVEEFIRDRFRDGDLAGILAGEKMVNNRLTSVRAELLEAVKQVKPRNDARTRSIELTRDWPRFLNDEEAIRTARNEQDVLRRVVSRACSDDPDACRQGTVDAEVMEKARRLQRDIHGATLQTLSAINALASGLARIPGPKTVVFLSDGFVVQDIETSLRAVVGQTARAGARVYAVDVRGLGRAGNAGIIDQAQAADPYGAVTTFDSVADGTNSLAVDTGGMMIRNENNIGRALSRIADDAGRYYVLAYRPANQGFDGKFRAIQVRVKRDGMRVRARRGYLALEPARMTVPQPVKIAPERSPDEAAVGAGASAEARTVDVAPVPAPAAAAVPASAAVSSTPSAAPPAGAPPPDLPAPINATRLRPDSEARVRALSEHDPSPSTDLARSGWEAYQRGDVEAAVGAFTQAAAHPDVRPWVLYALGLSQAGLGRTADAIVSWERVRLTVPDFEPVYMDLADTYAQMSDLTRALAVLRDAQKRWPDSADVESAIGVIHVRRGALDDGIAALTRATSLAPENPLMHLNLGRAYHLRFGRDRRYVTSQRRWISPDGDRQKAAAAFQRCIDLGGPYTQQAREALNLLEWSK